MCGITGVISDKDAVAKCMISLESMRNRGMDGSGIASEDFIIRKDSPEELERWLGNELDENAKKSSKIVLGHNLHSIVGNTPQPIEGKEGILVANCEIYNWRELDESHNLGTSNDAEVLMELIEKEGPGNLKKVLDMLDGVYAFAYWHKKGEKIYLARDILGVKPLWFSTDGGIAFASEKGALEKIGIRSPVELNPRKIIIHDLKSGLSKKEEKEFFKRGSTQISGKAEEDVKAKTKDLLEKAILKRTAGKKTGLLFSGGIDSVFIAKMLKDMGVDFSCYIACLEEEGMSEAEDFSWAKRAAESLNLDLKVKRLSLKDSEDYLKKVIPLIGDNNVVKSGVGVTMYAACEKAKEDGVKVMFSGLGSEEIFAGYERHIHSQDINKECVSGLLKIYERDLYRDDVISMHNSMELRLPFLDRDLVKHSLNIPGNLKIAKGQNKLILREIAEDIGIPKDLAKRKKKAAQYGSKFDRAIQRLAQRNGFKRKSDYLRRLYGRHNLKLGVLWSGGKDSAFAAWTMIQQNYEVACLISIDSANKDSYMFHTPNMDLTAMHSEATGIPVLRHKTDGNKEEELDDLRAALREAKAKYGIDGIVTGAIFSDYQRERVDDACDDLELKIFSPLWHMEQKSVMTRLLKDGFEVMIVRVAAHGLDAGWLGRKIDSSAVEDLVRLNSRYGINIAGEGGEFETLVLDAPFFKQRIVIDNSESSMDTECSGVMDVTEAHLEKKSE